VTTEQTIVLGVLAVAFIAGWAVHALVGRSERPPESEHGQRPAYVPDEHLAVVVEQSKEHLDDAIRSYMSALAATIAIPPEPAAEPPPLADEVSAALKDDSANEEMIDGVHGNGLTERELDLADWGFAYGVAWARVRDRRPADPDEAVARDARRAAESVFRDYAADAGWAKAGGEAQENGDGPAAAPDASPA
jgi:hypothetical protein